MYLPPSAKFLKNRFNLKQNPPLTPLISLIHFDKEYYISAYPDMRNLRESDCHTHYIFTGYYENRFPFKASYDFEFMRTSYADLADFSDEKLIEHFTKNGYHEGRLSSLPHFDAEFYISNYGGAIDTKKYDITDERDLVLHFINEGYANLLIPYAIGSA